jgi:hypothetical protein
MTTGQRRTRAGVACEKHVLPVLQHRTRHRRLRGSVGWQEGLHWAGAGTSHMLATGCLVGLVPPNPQA